MAEINRFSTLDLPSGLRFKVWRERLRRSFGDVSGSSRSIRRASYVHKIFSADGQTLSSYIRLARLERCRRDLGRAELTHLSVTEIAFSWGFQHQAHFSRVFRNHFNVSPSSCRQLT
jgi:AraC-like DNA-binding protein